VKRLGLALNEDDRKEIEGIMDRVKAEKQDELVRKTLAEYYIGEYFTIMRPESCQRWRQTGQNRTRS